MAEVTESPALRYDGSTLRPAVIVSDRRLMLFWLGTISMAVGCGDLGAVEVKLMFPDDATRASTRRLVFVTRDVAKTGGDPCATLWSGPPNTLAERRVAVDYPNRSDILAAAVDLNKYPKLTILVYAHPGKDVTQPPIAGGCQTVAVDPNNTTRIEVKLTKRPG